MRPETGPMQFGEDWPGVFIRGDNAMYYALLLKRILTALENSADTMTSQLDHMALNGLISLFKSCDARTISDKAELLDYSRCMNDPIFCSECKSPVVKAELEYCPRCTADFWQPLDD